MFQKTTAQLSFNSLNPQQMACESGSVLKRHYHHGAVLRDERLRSQFVDILYDLNDVAFVLENKVLLGRRRGCVHEALNP